MKKNHSIITASLAIHSVLVSVLVAQNSSQGPNHNITGNYNVVTGSYNTVSGNDNFVNGSSNVANSHRTLVGGTGNDIYANSDYAMVFGLNNFLSASSPANAIFGEGIRFWGHTISSLASKIA